jgi:hypothetical protein
MDGAVFFRLDTLLKEEQSMRKLAAVFLTLLFASTASAQVISNPTFNSRMGGMGVDNWQVEDDFNIFINPAQLSNYKNYVYGELGTWASPDNLTTHPFGGVNNDRVLPWGGLNMDVSYGGWGVYLGRPYAGPLNTASTLITGAGQTLTAPTANRFDLFYATHGLPLGFYLSYASRASEVKTAGTKVTDDASEINLGVGALIMNDMLDLAINLGLPSYEANDGTTKLQDNAGLNLALLGRLQTGLGGNAKLLTTGQIVLADSSVKKVADASSQTIRLDTAINAKPNPDTLLVAGVGIVYISTENKPKPTGSKATTSDIFIPVNVALEHQTFKAVKTRIGLSKPIYSTFHTKNVVAPGTKTTTVNDGAATVSMGLGWAIVDNLMLDAVLNQDVLFTGTYAVSGIPETLSSMLSLTYRTK